MATFIQSRKKNTGKSIKDTLTAGVPDRYGVLNISEDNSFMYAGGTLGFNEFRLFVQSSFFKGNGGHFVQYRTLVITKRKTEHARKRSRNGEDYFMMKLPDPVSCIDNFKKALEMEMTANGMAALFLDKQLRMMGKVRMCTATEQALKVYTQQLNKELYKRQGEEMMKEAELAAAATISAEGEENMGEVAAEEEAAAEEASAESMDDETASMTAVAGSSETEGMDMIEGELEEDEAKKRKEEKKKARYSPISDPEDAAGKKAEEEETVNLGKLKKSKKMSKEQLAALAEELETDKEFMRELVEKRKQKKKEREKRSKEFLSSDDSEADAEMEEKQQKKEKKKEKNKENVSSDDSDAGVDDETMKRLLGSSMYSTFMKKKK